MGIFFISIYNFFEKRKPWLWLFTVLSLALAAFFASRVRLEEDITRILPRDKKIDRLQQFLQNSKFADKLVITISQQDTTDEAQPDSLVAFATAFAEQAETLQPYIKTMQGQTDDAAMLELMGTIQSNLPVFLEAQDYAKIDTLLQPETLKATLASNYNTLLSPAGMVMKKMIQSDPVGISWLGVKKLQQLQYDEQFDLYDNFVVTKDLRHLMIFITPTYPPGATGQNAVFLQQIDQVFDSLQHIYPSVSASYFGATAVSVGNAQQLRQDTLFTQGITVVLLIVLIALFFRRKRAPLLVMTPVVFGALFALAMVYFIQGSISVIALGGGCVVLGIAVNYSLHVFNHYRHLPDIRQVIRDLALPMTVGGFTTIGGFLCLQFVKSPMLQDIGLVAALSLVGAALFSLIFLPHFVVIGKQPAQQEVKHNFIDRLAEYRPERNKYLVYGILALTVVFFFTMRKVGFESDMMRMNFMQDKLKVAEDKLNRINNYTATSVYLISEGKTLEEALQRREEVEPALQQLQQSSAVKKTSGVSGLLLSEKEQKARIARWNSYWTPEKKQQLLAFLQREAAQYKFKPEAFDPFKNLLDKAYTVLSPAASGLLNTGFLADFVTQQQGAASVVTILKVDPAKKDAVYAALDGKEHTVVFDKQYTANRLAEVIQEEFNSIAWMTGALVFLALLISYGRIELALITFIPMLLSWVWILGIMGMFGIKFNIVNIILSTFIFGLGDDYSIFTMDGLLEEYRTGKRHLSSFKSSIFFSAITTILGLGVLIFAKHPSLRSIALISIIGISCVVLISQVMIPFFFNWLITNRVKKGRAPWTLFGWAKSVFSFTYFVTGSLVMTLLGTIFIRLNPFKSEKIKYLYHVLLSKYTWSVLYIMTNVKKKVINEHGEDYHKPAVIISNHQSFLDILVSTMMHPKVILLTNQWVWKSPVFGAVVQMADYYPVADGVEGSVEKLKAKVDLGYSIVIYPEGTRSSDTSIKRFHKGAFYLAEQLGLDIMPMVLHGTAYTMSKNDFLLKDGTVTVKYLPRIQPGDKSWGEGYAARTKSISRYFKKEYEQLRSETEVPAYFREQLIYNYIYKGPVLEWYMRIKTRMEKNYVLFDQLVPKQGRILDIGCGYGFLSYMLHWTQPARQITGLDYDEDKIATAQHGYLRGETLQFVHADATQYAFGEHDTFIISDVLHYLRPEAQEALIVRCIQQLAPGGSIIIRDGDAELEERHKGTKLTELFSTKLLGFNKTGENALSFLKASTIRELAARHGVTVEQIDQTKYTSNIIFVLKHQHAHI